MADRTLELRAILDSAERAAAAQDFASAAEFLRRAATLQEAEHGSQHPDLANTFNNLGIVYEGLGQAADAEASYRKAYAIATATLAPNDPLVVTSRENLRDFCVASGRPFNLGPGAPSPVETTHSPYESADFASERDFAPEPVAATVPRQTAKPGEAPTPIEPPRPVPRSKPIAASKPTPPAPEHVARKAPTLGDVPLAVPVPIASPSRNRSMTWLVVAAGLVLAFVIVFAGPWSGSEDSATTESPAPAAPASAPPQPVTAPPPAEAAAPPPTPATPAPVDSAPAPAEKTSPPAEPSRSRPAPPASNARSASAAAAASVADARVCRSLSTSNWRCTEAAAPANPGVFFFYTRVKSARPTTVQHRWYQDGTLRRTVNLRIAANPSAGYRTYSRNTVTAERRGEWRVELRDAEGALLHEERLVVK